MTAIERRVCRAWVELRLSMIGLLAAEPANSRLDTPSGSANTIATRVFVQAPN